MLEHSCRTGRCGACKAMVLSGETVALRHEGGLTDAEHDAGLILTCCRAPASDLTLDVEDLGRLAAVRARILPCRIQSLDRLSGDILRVALRTPPTMRLNYVAGQYVDVIAGSLKRSYSIANGERADASIELLIRRYDGGAMSRYWFDEAKVNDLLRIEGPLGTFHLRAPHPPHLVFLATGTGIAPVRAMLHEIATSGVGSSPRMSVYWGNRYEADLCWEPPAGLDLDFHPVLSRGAGSWRGRRGHVQDLLCEDVDDMREIVVYACGSPAMIESAREQLVSRGLRRNRFFADAFVASN